MDNLPLNFKTPEVALQHQPVSQNFQHRFSDISKFPPFQIEKKEDTPAPVSLLDPGINQSLPKEKQRKSKLIELADEKMKSRKETDAEGITIESPHKSAQQNAKSEKSNESHIDGMDPEDRDEDSEDVQPPKLSPEEPQNRNSLKNAVTISNVARNAKDARSESSFDSNSYQEEDDAAAN